VLLFFSLLVLGTGPCDAYTGSPFRIFSSEEERPFSIFVEAVSDVIYDRSAKFQVDDMEVDFYGGIAGITWNNRYVLYGGMGAASVEEAYTILNNRISWETDYGFTWLTGGVLKVYERDLQCYDDSRLLVSLDIQYRNTDLDSDVITIDSVEYHIPHPQIDYETIEYNDWHVALACGLDLGILGPYFGVKYSDFESCPRVRMSGVMYEKNNVEADNNFGIFVGASLKAVDSIYATIEASFIDENSLSGSLTYRF